MDEEEIRQCVEVAFADKPELVNFMVQKVREFATGEAAFSDFVEAQVRGFVNSNEYAYRSIMLHLAMARCYGQYDGAIKTMQTDFNTSIRHILAEVAVTEDKYARVHEEYTL
jgi:hypothetical protein